jgi:glycosyltransferase involved in cell wall biosynthesis
LNGKLPSVTILIAARPRQTVVKAVEASRTLDYPPELIEIILARGRQPSAQRNAALRAAHGELIYFLDDDSLPERENLRRAAPHFADGDVQMLGGPNLCPPEAPWLERVFSLVLASWLAFGPSRARYIPVGELRQTTEKELILCNLIARRSALLGLGGFNEALYPNEENALMDELQKRQAKLLYDPCLRVFRRPRPDLKAFLKMLTTYGRGRAEQLRAHPGLGSALNLAPPLFCFYLAAVAVMVVVASIGAARLFSRGIFGLALAPLFLYALALAAQGIYLLRKGGVCQAMAALPLVVLTHLLYGVGFLRGLFTPLRPPEQRPSPEVALEFLPCKGAEP